MSIDNHDQFCGSFGEHSDCQQCRMSTRRVGYRKSQRTTAADSIERVLVGAMIHDPSLIPLVKQHLPEPVMFPGKQCRTLAQHIYRLHDQRLPVTYAEVGRSLHATGEVKEAGGYCVMHDLEREVPMNANIESYATMLAHSYSKGDASCR